MSSAVITQVVKHLEVLPFNLQSQVLHFVQSLDNPITIRGVPGRQLLQFAGTIHTGRYLLDTNIVIALFDNEPTVTASLRKVQDIFVPSIVIGELYYGAQGSGRVKQNVARVDNFVVVNRILACNSKTSETYGLVKSALKMKLMDSR